MRAAPQRGHEWRGATPAAAPEYPLTAGALVYYETLHNGLCACRVVDVHNASGSAPPRVHLAVTARSHPLYDLGDPIHIEALRYVLPRDKALYFRRGRATCVRPFHWLIGNEVKQ